MYFLSRRNRSHIQTHDKNNTTNDDTKNHPPHLITIEVARRRCVPPPTPGWVAAPKSAWEVGSKSDAPWGALGSGAPRPAHCAHASLSEPDPTAPLRVQGNSGSVLNVPCSHEVGAMGKFILPRYLSEFCLRVSSF